MTEAQREYVDFLTRYTRTNGKSIEEANRERTSRDVGEHYGLTGEQMDEAVRKAVL